MAKIIKIVSIEEVQNIDNEGFLCMCMVIEKDYRYTFPAFEYLSFYFYEHDDLIKLVHAENFNYLCNSLKNAGKLDKFLSTFTNEEKLLVELEAL